MQQETNLYLLQNLERAILMKNCQVRVKLLVSVRLRNIQEPTTTQMTLPIPLAVNLPFGRAGCNSQSRQGETEFLKGPQQVLSVDNLKKYIYQLFSPLCAKQNAKFSVICIRAKINIFFEQLKLKSNNPTLVCYILTASFTASESKLL